MDPEKKEQKFTVNHIIFHNIEKKQHNDATLILREEEFSEEYLKDIANKFIIQFTDNFSNPRKTNRSFGQFIDCSETNYVPFALKKYKKSEIAFLKMSQNFATQFHKEINTVPLATGGFIFCIDYFQGETHMFAIIVLDIKSGFEINAKTMDFNYASEILELEKMNMAVRINLDKWEEEESYIKDCTDEQEIEELEKKNYLSFIAGKKNLTQYFYKFICSKRAENKTKATNFVKDSILDFHEEMYGTDDDYDEKRKTLVNFLFTSFEKSRKSVTGINIKTLIESVFEDEEIQEKYFNQYSEKYASEKIPNQFIPDKRAYSKLVECRYKKKGVDLRMEKEWLDNHADFTDDNTLVIKVDNIKNELLGIE